MTCLPIVDRELRVAARRKSVFRARFGAAVLGCLFAGSILVVAQLSSPTVPGSVLFYGLTYSCLTLALLAGVFLTADCISEERRDGTLGFLFLTSLRGRDVVLGKLVSRSLWAVYAMLALAPMLALSLILGAVTFGEFVRTVLALLGALFFSLALGLLVSALSWDGLRSMAAAFLCVSAVSLALIPLGGFSRSSSPGYLSLGSPVVTTLLAQDSHYARSPGSYWASMAIVHVMAWMVLGAAAHFTRRYWTEGPPASRETAGNTRRWFLPSHRRVQLEPAAHALLEQNPVAWLATQGMPRFRWAWWWIIALWLGWVWVFLARQSSVMGWVGVSQWAVMWLVKILFTAQFCGFLAEARQTGLLDLIFCTPITSPEIREGLTLALKRRFLWLILVLLAGLGLAPVYAAITGAPPSFTLSGTMAGTGIFVLTGLAGIGMAVFAMATHFFDFVALGWFGAWLALTMRKPRQAAGLTLLCVLVLPSFLFCIPRLLTDLAFFAWARQKLRQDLRSVCADAGRQKPLIHSAAAPQAALPPVIG